MTTNHATAPGIAPTVSYDTQLQVIEHRFRLAQAAGDMSEQRLLLSFAESVKDARDHALNCMEQLP